MKNIIKIWKLMFAYAAVPCILKIVQGILLCVSTPLSVHFVEKLIDQCIYYVRGNSDSKSVLLSGTLLGVFMLILAGNTLINQVIDTYLQKNVENKIPRLIINKYMSIPYSDFEKADTQNIFLKMGSTPQKTICEIFSKTIVIMSSVISLVTTAILFTDISVIFPFGFVVFICIIVYCDCKAMRMMDDVYQEQSVEERRLEYYTKLLCNKESLYGLKVLAAVPFIHKKMDNILEEVQKERLKIGILSQKYMLISSLAFKAWIGFILFFMVYALLCRSITIGVFISLISAIDLIVSIIDRISYNISMLSLQYNQAVNFRLFLELDEKIRPFCSAISKNCKKKNIVFRNVFFKYPGMEEYVLNDLSFEIREGENVSIVGENGCGKSTIVKLLCGLYEPERGEILIGGKDIRSIPQEELSVLLSVVFQDYYKYYLSLRENIGFGDVEKMEDEDELLKAAQRGNALGILDKCGDKGLCTNLGNISDDGIDLSGGEWQKVATSRGNLKASSFILMDEPTAALDPSAENEMYTTFVNILKRREQGSIIISHRLASAKISDKVIVICNGCVCEQGTHEELMQKDHGYYRDMFDAQRKWYIEKV